MPTHREIQYLLLAILISFALVMLTATYWAIVGPDSLLQREDNPRLVEAEARLIRGDIVDRHATPLVTSSIGAAGRTDRVYHFAAMNSVLGYSSLRYGEGGLEAAFNTILRGDELDLSLTDLLASEALHRPQVGTSIQLTLDQAIQQSMATSMQGLRGAAVVLAVPSGEVLGLISLPTYDPNQLEEQWEALVAAPDKPFFNRVAQGQYQPGGLLQTPLLAAALLTGTPVDAPFPAATTAVTLNDLTLNCAVRLPLLDLTLGQSYGFACPAPFAALAEQLGTSTVQAAFDTFHLLNPPVLAELAPQPVSSSVQPTNDLALTDDNLINNALGQGEITVTPLEMAMMAAAIVNDGNAPLPRLLLATRPPDTDNWQSVSHNSPARPYMTAQTARQLQDFMRATVASGAAINASRANIDIGGHTTTAYSGTEQQAWFVGFVTLSANRGAAIAVVIEDSADVGRAADIGGTILASVHQRSQITN